MPDKDPGLWLSICESARHLRAAIVGMFVALLRVMYDDREPSTSPVTH